MERNFEAPGPGTWELETTHFVSAMPPYAINLIGDGIARGFREGSVKYGLMLDRLEMKDVHGFIYARQVMVGEPDEPKGPPPAWLMYVLTRVHPEMRRRNKAWLTAVKTKLWEKDLREFDTVMKPDSIRRNLALVNVDLPALDDDELLSHLDACSENMLEMYYRHHVYSVSAVAPVGALVAMVTESGTIDAGEAIALLKGSTPVSAGAFAEELDALVQSLRKAGIAASALEAVPPEDFCDHLRGSSPDIASALNRYLQFAGASVVSGYSIDEKTLNEVPNLIKSRILGSLASPAGVDSGVGNVDAQIASVRSRLPQAQQADFDFWIETARKVNRLRDERGVYNDTWAAGISRTAILEAGRRLAERGVLPEAELALECTEPELSSLIRGENADITSELVQRREWRRSTRIEDCPEWLGVPPSADPPPLHLLPAGLRGAMKALLAGLTHLNDMEPAPEVDRESDANLTLQGIAVSRGTYEGTARVISGPDDFGRIQQGDVLITKNTSAAFNAVLASLGALVTDRGGLLSHAAIVSREYGIPGVVATKRATHSIPDGSRVRVNGDNGTVSLLS